MPIEDPKLDSLRPGSREMERGHWEGQNFQRKEVQCLEEEELCVPRLPEDDTPVLKHVGMILIMNWVLWYVLYGTLLSEFLAFVG